MTLHFYFLNKLSVNVWEWLLNQKIQECTNKGCGKEAVAFSAPGFDSKEPKAFDKCGLVLIRLEFAEEVRSHLFRVAH